MSEENRTTTHLQVTGMRLVPIFFFCSYIISHTNELTEQQRNPVTIEFVERNQNCVGRQVFFPGKYFLLCSHFFHSSPIATTPTTVRIYYCDDDTITVYRRQRRAGPCRMLSSWLSVVAVEVLTVECWLWTLDSANQWTKYEYRNQTITNDSVDHWSAHDRVDNLISCWRWAIRVGVKAVSVRQVGEVGAYYYWWEMRM